MSLNTLNESLDIIANLVIPRLEDDVDVIQKLDDEPNDVGGLTAAELKAKFDEAANIIKTYLNETLVPQLSDTVAEAEVRAQAEAERIANERARVEGENLREEAEDAREENEDARVQAEEARVSAESGRVAAESSRSSAESTRQNNEQERQTQESTRQANEETRQSQESTRQTNEQTRQTQEQARATAEAQRAAAEAARRNTFATELSQAQTARSAAEAAAKAVDEDAQYVEESKDLSKSWAVGGTGTREGEDTNNAMYWSEQAKNYAGGGVTSFNGRNGAVVPKTGDYTAEQVGADPKGTADAKVSEHNTSEASHQDLRLALSGHLASKNNPHNVTADQVGAIAAGAVGNLHVWQRVQQNLEAGYELGQGSLTTILSANTNTITALSYYVCDSISVASDGTVFPVSEEKVVINFTSGTAHTGTDALKGKFGRKSQTSSTFYFFPSNCVFTDYVVTKHNIQASNAQLVTGYPAGTTTDYLTSTDPNAYPKQSAEGGQDAYYTLGDVEVGSFNLSSENNTAANITFYTSASVSVADDGTLSLVSPTDQRFQGSQYLSNADAFLTNAKGGYIMTDSSECGFLAGEVYFIPSDAEGSYNSPGWYLTKRQKVTGYPAIPANTVITYLGQLGEPGARIEVGSYVGTGTYGTLNRCSLTFSSTPKMVFIKASNDARTMMLFYGHTRGDSTESTSNKPFTTWDGNTVTWYADVSAYFQFNSSGDTYDYLAFY